MIVIETCFGNTAQVAEAVTNGLTSRGATVSVVKAHECRPEHVQGVDLLLVGAPTHNRGLPGPASRRLAVTQGANPPATGVAEWLEELPKYGYQGKAAAFDSVSGTTFWNGSAAKKIQKKLVRVIDDVAEPESFLVVAAEGPSAAGELERAEKWGASLV
nr:flavodoxin domain-containing protein [Kineosporia babensis]